MRLIDADVLAEELWRIRRNLQMMDDTQTADKMMRGLRRAEEKMEAAPTIDPVKHGKWIEHEWAEEYDGRLISNYECSECKSWERERTNYCPNC